MCNLLLAFMIYSHNHPHANCKEWLYEKRGRNRKAPERMETGGTQWRGWISRATEPPSETAFGAVFFSFSFSPETLICGMNEGLISSRESALIHDNIMAYMKNVRSRQTMKNLYLHLSVCIHQQVPLLRFSGWNLQMESLGKVWNYP